MTPDLDSLDMVRDALKRAEEAERERDAYRKAKAENDERFQLECGELREELTRLQNDYATAMEGYARMKEERDLLAALVDMLPSYTQGMSFVSEEGPRELYQEMISAGVIDPNGKILPRIWLRSPGSSPSGRKDGTG